MDPERLVKLARAGDEDARSVWRVLAKRSASTSGWVDPRPLSPVQRDEDNFGFGFGNGFGNGSGCGTGDWGNGWGHGGCFGFGNGDGAGGGFDTSPKDDGDVGVDFGHGFTDGHPPQESCGDGAGDGERW